MGRKRRWSEDMQARFPAGTFERIETVLGNWEDRTDFVRAAVEREIKHRERLAAREQTADKQVSNPQPEKVSNLGKLSLNQQLGKADIFQTGMYDIEQLQGVTQSTRPIGATES